jgi:ubiquinone/menaquinone biosynthesis C-methylase UbiE
MAQAVAQIAFETKPEPARVLKLEHTQCCVCLTDEATPVGLGTDFEYQTSPDTFLAMQCDSCGLVYLNPRPSVADLDTIYPDSYHAFDFSEEDFGFVHKVRSRLEANRLLEWCKSLPDDAKILDIGCGDGFHLDLLKTYGRKTWTVEGIDLSERAAAAAARRDIKVHVGTVENIGLPENTYDLAIMIQTIEHVERPDAVLLGAKRLLKSGGKLVIVTDNTGAPDFNIFKGSYWGGYHFPRHWNLFNKNSLTKLAEKSGFDVDDLITAVSPVNWVYSIHNMLVDLRAPRWLINRFTLKSLVSLSAFTALDIVLQKFGRGALLRAILRKPENSSTDEHG